MSDTMQTFEGFLKVYEGFVKISKTYKEAFDRANDQHMRIFGLYRYSDYKSFTVVKTRKIK
jgi:hypothetical protein